MGKRTQAKADQKPDRSASEKHELMPVRPANGSLQRVFPPIDATLPFPRAAGSGLQHEQIAVRAYQIWKAHGRPEGTDREDWIEAEQQLLAEKR